MRDPLESCALIATKLYGWENINGMWGWSKKSLSGWKVATEARIHTPGQGYFRPDRSYFQLYYVVLPALGGRLSYDSDRIRIGGRVFLKLNNRLSPKELTDYLATAIEAQPDLFDTVMSVTEELVNEFRIKTKEELLSK